MAEVDWNTNKYQDTDQKDVDVSAVDEKIRSECNAELQSKHRAPQKISESAPLTAKDLRVLSECSSAKRDAFEEKIVNEKAAKILSEVDDRLRNAALLGKLSLDVMPVKDYDINRDRPPLAEKVLQGLNERGLTSKIERRDRNSHQDPYTHKIVAYWERWKW